MKIEQKLVEQIRNLRNDTVGKGPLDRIRVIDLGIEACTRRTS